MNEHNQAPQEGALALDVSPVFVGPICPPSPLNPPVEHATYAFPRVVVLLCGILLTLLAGLRMAVVAAVTDPVHISIDYPLNDSVFPPDFAPPTVQWRDPSSDDSTWKVDVSFADNSPSIHLISRGERRQIGKIDERCISNTNKLPELTADF